MLLTVCVVVDRHDVLLTVCVVVDRRDVLLSDSMCCCGQT